MDALKRYHCLLHRWVRKERYEFMYLFFLIAVRIGRTNSMFICELFYSREI